MKDQPSVLDIYQQRIEYFNTELKKINSIRSRIAWLRFAIALITILLVYISYRNQPIFVLFIEIIIGLAMFLFVVSKDVNAKEKAQDLERHIFINEEEIKIAKGDYLHRENGSVFLQLNHSYANDLDIFGEASLYQYINRCTAEMSNILLAKHLSHPQTKEEILQQQEAAKELAENINWRQKIVSAGMVSSLSASTQKRLEDWLNNDDLNIYTNIVWQWIAYIFPIVSIGALCLYLTDIISSSFFYAALSIFFLFAFFISKKVNAVWVLLSRVVKETGALHHQLALIEKQDFTNKKYNAVKDFLRSEKGDFASAEIKNLYAILNRFDVRLNVFAFFFLNTFFLWDLQQMLSLNKWKNQNKNNVAKWFAAIAETEVLVSIATLAYNNADWCFPNISDEHFTLEGTAIGHPLLAQNKRVNNDFSINGKGKIAIVTGSNMGGKSTFLRSIGVNMMLAFMGAPVCAKSFTISVVNLVSSMRVTDNLAESTSTFYAELKKLQAIIQAVKNEEKIFILLDEILRGTNSLDRHTGSAALIKQLIKNNAVAVVATHDVELAKLIEMYPQAIANYHFDVQVAGDNLYFDYKLKDGICQSMNASILMKNIGIEME